MPTKLRNLLVATGIAIGGVALYIVAPDTTRAELRDAGADSCSPVLVRAEAYFDGQYRTFRTKGLQCGDAGIILPRLPPRAVLFRPDLVEVVDATGCSVAAACDDGPDGEPQEQLAQDRCACRGFPDAGLCRWRDPYDGGIAAAPFGITLNAGGFQGPGCVPKPCGELAGFSSWPDECPQ